jgi:hypothetical protein
VFSSRKFPRDLFFHFLFLRHFFSQQFVIDPRGGVNRRETEEKITIPVPLRPSSLPTIGTVREHGSSPATLCGNSDMPARPDSVPRTQDEPPELMLQDLTPGLDPWPCICHSYLYVGSTRKAQFHFLCGKSLEPEKFNTFGSYLLCCGSRRHFPCRQELGNFLQKERDQCLQSYVVD